MNVHSLPHRATLHVEGAAGLIRQNSKLRASKGVREENEEELLTEAFSADFRHLASALQALEEFRLKVIDWLYPDVQS